MKQIQICQKQSKTLISHKAGFSDMRMWPCYMVTTALILLLSPSVSSFGAFILVLVPAFRIATKIATRQANNPQTLKQYQDVKDAIYSVQTVPDLRIYEVDAPSVEREHGAQDQQIRFIRLLPV